MLTFRINSLANNCVFDDAKPLQEPLALAADLDSRRMTRGHRDPLLRKNALIFVSMVYPHGAAVFIRQHHVGDAMGELSKLCFAAS